MSDDPRWSETTSGGDRTCDDCQRTIHMGELWYCAEWRDPRSAIWHRCTNCRALYGESFKYDAPDERQRHYERGVDALNRHHPLGSDRATPADLLVIIGRYDMAIHGALPAGTNRPMTVHEWERLYAATLPVEGETT